MRRSELKLGMKVVVTEGVFSATHSTFDHCRVGKVGVVSGLEPIGYEGPLDVHLCFEDYDGPSFDWGNSKDLEPEGYVVSRDNMTVFQRIEEIERLVQELKETL